MDTRLSQNHYWMPHGLSLPPRPGRGLDKWGLDNSWGSRVCSMGQSLGALLAHTIPAHSPLPEDPAHGRKACVSMHTHKTLGLLPRNIGSWDRRVFVKKGEEEPWCLLWAPGWGKRNTWHWEEAGPGLGHPRCSERLSRFLRLLGRRGWVLWKGREKAGIGPSSSTLSWGDPSGSAPAFFLECGRYLRVPQKVDAMA